MKQYTEIISADFETTVNPVFTQVWLAGCYNIYTQDFKMWKSQDEMWKYISQKNGRLLYFHNLRFDGAFILWHLTQNLGYTWTADKPGKGQFSTVISDMRQYYRFEIHWKNGNRTEIRDSLKVIRMPLRDIPKAFGLPQEKGRIEYDSYTTPPQEINDLEIDYLYKDCKIVGDALKILWDHGNNRLSSAANALAAYKTSIGMANYDAWFPKLPLTIDRFVRKAYKGGYVYVPEEYRGKWCGKGFVVDVNSLYPSRCACVEDTPLPYGFPEAFKGKPTKNMLYVVQIRCSFELKHGYLPTIQIKNNARFSETEYLRSSVVDGLQTRVELFLTNIDLQIMFDHYDIYDIEYVGGYYFQSRKDMWIKHVSENMQMKEEATLEGNKGKRQIAKNNMNEPTGKFATRPEMLSMRPDQTAEKLSHKLYDELNPDGHKLTQEEQRKYDEKEQNRLVYTPMSVFITAWGRNKMIRTAQRLYEEGIFRYCDTDSAHCEGKMPLWLWKQCDHTKLGWWDVEGTFCKAKFLRAKTYMEFTKYVPDPEKEMVLAKKCDYTYKWNIKCAGMPHSIHDQVTPQNFVVGAHFPGKLQQKSVPGGAILVDVGFTIK